MRRAQMRHLAWHLRGQSGVKSCFSAWRTRGSRRARFEARLSHLSSPRLSSRTLFDGLRDAPPPQQAAMKANDYTLLELHGPRLHSSITKQTIPDVASLLPAIVLPLHWDDIAVCWLAWLLAASKWHKTERSPGCECRCCAGCFIFTTGSSVVVA